MHRYTRRLLVPPLHTTLARSTPGALPLGDWDAYSRGAGCV
jgi:hypothetical protein